MKTKNRPDRTIKIGSRNIMEEILPWKFLCMGYDLEKKIHSWVNRQTKEVTNLYYRRFQDVVGEALR